MLAISSKTIPRTTPSILGAVGVRLPAARARVWRDLLTDSVLHCDLNLLQDSELLKKDNICISGTSSWILHCPREGSEDNQKLVWPKTEQLLVHPLEEWLLEYWFSTVCGDGRVFRLDRDRATHTCSLRIYVDN